MNVDSSDLLVIAAFAGSLRKNSYNRALLDASTLLAPAGMTVAPMSIHDLPLFNGDVEDEGPPLSVTRLNLTVADSDGLIIFTPEYNGSIPAVTKNVVDWLSRENCDDESPLYGKPIAIASATPGNRAGRLAREQLSNVMASLTDTVFDRTLGIPNISDKLDSRYQISDERTRDALTIWLSEFEQYIRHLQRDQITANSSGSRSTA